MSTPRRPGDSTGSRISEQKALRYTKEAEARKEKEAKEEAAKKETAALLTEPKPPHPSGRRSPMLLRFNATDVVETRIETEDPSPRIIQPEQNRFKK